MKPIKILALILVTIVFFSCSEKEVIESEEIVETTKLFKYNSNGYIKSITTYNSNNIETSHIKYEYNAEKQLVKRIDYKAEKRTKERDDYFSYDLNGYVKTQKTVYPNGSEMLINFDYEIVGNNIKVKNNILYTYEYKNGNLLFFTIGNSIKITYINYDNKENPYYEGFPLSFSIIGAESKNNILKHKRSGSSEPKYNNTVTYEYDYNSDGLPTKKTYYDTLQKKPVKFIVNYKYEK